MRKSRVRRLLVSDEDRVAGVTTLIAAAELFQRENRRKAKRLAARSIRNYLERILDQEPTRGEILRVLRKGF
jgi:hypothetical protein